MTDNVKLLTNELWGLMKADAGKLDELRALKRRDDRQGYVKLWLRSVIKASSIGVFNNIFHTFGDTVYIPVTYDDVKNAVTDILAYKIKLPYSDIAYTQSICDECFSVIRSKPLVLNSNIMVFRNGVLDVEKNTFSKKFGRQFVQLWGVDYDYNPEARTFLWYQFLNQVLPDKRLQDVLQMFLGATFVDRNKASIEHMLILLGNGANGKSVISRAVRGVLGEPCVSKESINKLCLSGIDGDEARAKSNGKRLNYCTELEATDFYKKGEQLKKVVSGEPCDARFRFHKSFTAYNLPLLMANANRLPVFSKDNAMMRRIYIIPFKVSIPAEKQNKTLSDELVEEYPAILNWILEGRQKFIDSGYKLPADASIEKYLREEKAIYNQELKFMDVHGWLPKIEGVSLMPLNWRRVSDVYAEYKRWCENNNLKPIGQRAFSYTLESQGGFMKQRRSNGICFAIYGEITLNTLKKQTAKQRKAERDARRLNRALDKNPKAVLTWVDGVAWLSSLKALAAYAGVGKTVTLRLYREGRFKQYTRAWREKNLYDVKSCCEVMRSFGLLASDAEKEIDSRIRKELKYMRYIFNQRMEYNGWPYRMYGSDVPQIDDSIIVVPDETSDDEVYQMAVKAGLDMSHWEKSGKGQGAFGRRGKGFFDSVDDIPTDEEREIWNNIKE